MAEILILTEDPRLYRMLCLLCEEAGHTVGAAASSLVVTNQKEISSRFSSLPVLLIGETGLSRPFSHIEFKKRIEELLSEESLPVFTPTEEKLYRILKNASPDFVSRDTLMREVFEERTDTGKLNLYIHYLRKKIEMDGKKRIFASRGKGYCLLC